MAGRNGRHSGMVAAAGKAPRGGDAGENYIYYAQQKNVITSPPSRRGRHSCSPARRRHAHYLRYYHAAATIVHACNISSEFGWGRRHHRCRLESYKPFFLLFLPFSPVVGNRCGGLTNRVIPTPASCLKQATDAAHTHPEQQSKEEIERSCTYR